MVRMVSVVGCCLIMFVLLSSCYACGSGQKDCERVDCGTCGNACCKMQFVFNSSSSSSLLKSILAVLSNGGPDQMFALQTTAEGSFGYVDLRSLESGYDYLGLVTHTTGPYPRQSNFVDNIYWTIQSNNTAGNTILEVFSISTIGGALCDIGQNYWNIITWVKTLGYSTETTLFGCPKPTI